MSLGSFGWCTGILDHWHYPPGMRRAAAAVLIGILHLSVGLIVYLTGGTKLAYPHLFYVPILLSAFCFGLLGGIAGALVAGLVAGPWMPLDVAAGLPQSTVNWLSRTGYFMLSGALAGIICSTLNAQKEAIRRHAYYDPLTELPNKTLLRERLTRAIETDPAAARVLMAVQIVQFEDINAAFGYRTADALLGAVAERLRGLSPRAEVFHLYAANFGVLCSSHDLRDARAFAEDLVGALKEPLIVNDGIPICIEGRVGLAQYPEHGDHAHPLLRAATFALHDAERHGEEIRLYDPARHREQKRALRILTHLRGGLSGSQLMLVYQPKVSLETGACVGVEALARWQHPSLGRIAPDLFTSIVEKTSIVRPFTEWALRSALQQVVAWREAGLDLAVAVNISVRNLEDPEFPKLLCELITEYGVAPDRLELEITERALMARPERALAGLERLRELRLPIAIDDFGTGQSSLSYLKELPVDALKIDRVFVQALAQEPKDRKIVRATIDLAHDMGLQVVAEGVETCEAYAYLRTLSCDIAQGYFVCRPQPPTEIAEWCRAWQERLPAPPRFDREAV